MTLVEASSSEAVDGSGNDAVPAAVEQIVRAVEARVNAARSEIERMVAREQVRFRGARLTQYVPLLVERAVLLRLRVLPATTEDACAVDHPTARSLVYHRNPREGKGDREGPDRPRRRGSRRTT